MILLLCAVIIIPLVFFIWMHGSRQITKNAGALAILGYRCVGDKIHPLLQDRLDTALLLLQKNHYQFIILSGGAVTSKKSEAEIMKNYLVSHGIESNKIIVEDYSRTTIQNLVNIKLILKKYRLHDCLFISNSFHIRRIRYIAKALDISASYYADRNIINVLKQWRLTFVEIKTFYHSKSKIDKLDHIKPLQMMGKKGGR